MTNSIINGNRRKSITLFFCDIYGTVDGGFTEEECKKFAGLLEKIKEHNNSDYLLFGMLSTEHPDITEVYEKKLSKYFDNDVLLMTKFQDVEALREAKISCALYYINYLKKNYNINSVFCADDISLIHEMFSELLKEKESITLNSIIPQKGENNLNFINNELEKRFIKTKTKKL